MERIPFIKMHGLGNDFVILDLRDGEVAPPPREVLAAMTCRKTGVGCDQLILMEPARDPAADLFMRILNAPDASEAEACGNATRCVAARVMREQGREEAVIQTVAGLLRCRAVNGERTLIEADMGIPRLDWREIPLAYEADTLHLEISEGPLRDPAAVNVGNPHVVFFIDELEGLEIEAFGPKLEQHPIFPERANIEFAQVLDRKTIRMRVWERDTGVTRACGSAACATLVAAVRRGLADRDASVVLDGGTLGFHWREEDGHLLMTGETAFVFRGEYG